MGLDSVELIVEVERYFSIRIPDAEAEKAYTVQNLVDIVARYRNVTSTDTTLREKIFSEVSSCIEKLIKTNDPIRLTDKISAYLVAGDEENWAEFEKLVILKVPRPCGYDPDSNKFSDRLRKLIHWTPNYDWQEILVLQFVDAICAYNYKDLLTPDELRNKHEIYIGVAGITADKMGIDHFEILPGKSFTTDLGVS